MVKRKGQTMIYKALYRNQKIEQYEPHHKHGINPDGPEESAIPLLNVAHAVLLLIQTL